MKAIAFLTDQEIIAESKKKLLKMISSMSLQQYFSRVKIWLIKTHNKKYKLAKTNTTPPVKFKLQTLQQLVGTEHLNLKALNDPRVSHQ